MGGRFIEKENALTPKNYNNRSTLLYCNYIIISDFLDKRLTCVSLQTILNFLIFTVIFIAIGFAVFAGVFAVGLLFYYITQGGDDLRIILCYPLYIVFSWLARCICCGRTKYTFCGRPSIPENRGPGQAEAQTTESTLPTAPSLVAFPSQSRSVPPPLPPSAPPSISTYVPASEPPSVSAYIPTSALPYVIPNTTSQEPSAQATLISPEAAAMYETATAVATMRPL